MYLYCGTTLHHSLSNTFKLGCTTDIRSRIFQYHTYHPPFDTFGLEKVWRLNVQTSEELFRKEQHIFDVFGEYRLFREKYGDSEWFQFPNTNFIGFIDDYIQQQKWFEELINIDELPRLIDTKNISREPILKPIYNRYFIYDFDERIKRLNQFQQPNIERLSQFWKNPEREAAVFISPCGTGKTRMSVESVRQYKSYLNVQCKDMKPPLRIVVCCPTQHIQRQWTETICSLGLFDGPDILCIGTKGTTSIGEIHRISSRESWCIITTYMSSNLLVDGLNRSMLPTLAIFDEAHHMSGYVGTGNTHPEGHCQGKTRMFLRYAVENHMKRLFLTYTPKHYDAMVEDETIYSMENSNVFGDIIANITLRHCISLGILPDYAIHHLYSNDGGEDYCDGDANGREAASASTTFVKRKADAIIKAWDQSHIVEHKEVYILHHMIVFVATIEDIRNMAEYLQRHIDDGSRIIPIYQHSNVRECIEEYTRLPRGIMVNCYILGEGVDVPITNAVAFMIPKQSPIQIIQMLLRAGRWYQDKPIFHVLLPTLSDDDMSGYFNVLLALAQNDPVIFNDICQFASENLVIKRENETPRTLEEVINVEPHRIKINTYQSSREQIIEFYKNLRKRVICHYSSREVQKLCQSKQIKSSFEYSKLREGIPELPERPLRGKTWFDFLNPYTSKITREEFHDLLESQSIQSVLKYEDFIQRQRNDEFEGVILPSIQNINDGYFGESIHNFNDVLNLKQSRKSKKKRR